MGSRYEIIINRIVNFALERYGLMDKAVTPKERAGSLSATPSLNEKEARI
jgi:hypothetical protein